MKITPYGIAKELGKPPQVVYKRIETLLKTPPVDVDDIGEHIKKQNGNWLITEKGQKIIINSFESEQQVINLEQTIEQLYSQNCSQLNNEINNLKEQLQTALDENKALNEKLLTEKENSNKILTEQNERILKLMENQQLLLGIEQVKTSPALLSVNGGEHQKKKQGLFSRIFGKKKD